MGPEAVDFLGCKISVSNGLLKGCMKLYVKKVETMARSEDCLPPLDHAVEVACSIRSP